MNKKIEVGTIAWIKDAYIASVNYKGINNKAARPRLCVAGTIKYLISYGLFSNQLRGNLKRKYLPMEISKGRKSYVNFYNPVIIPTHINHNNIIKIPEEIKKFIHESIFLNVKYEKAFNRAKKIIIEKSNKIHKYAEISI